MVKLNKIIGVEYTQQTCQMYDIEVNHPDHLFIAKSADGAIRSVS